jgi:hypothetical protein
MYFQSYTRGIVNRINGNSFLGKHCQSIHLDHIINIDVTGTVPSPFIFLDFLIASTALQI